MWKLVQNEKHLGDVVRKYNFNGAMLCLLNQDVAHEIGLSHLDTVRLLGAKEQTCAIEENARKD